MTETFGIILLGFAISIVTEASKKFNVNPRIIVASLVLVAALAYTGFNLYVDKETQTSIILFATATLGTAELFYSVVIKNMVK